MTMTIEEARAYLGKDYTVDYKPVGRRFIICHVAYLNYRHTTKVLDTDNLEEARNLFNNRIRDTEEADNERFRRLLVLKKAYDLSFDIRTGFNNVKIRPIMDQTFLIEDLWEEGLVNKFNVTLPDHILDPDQNPDHEDAFRYTDFYWLLLDHDEEQYSTYRIPSVTNSVTSKGFPVLEHRYLLWIGIPRKS